MNDFDHKIKEFADFILQRPEFREFQKAGEELESNKESLKIFQALQERQQTIAMFQQVGLPVSAEQRQELNTVISQLRANGICLRYLRAQSVAVSAAREVCNQLTATTGVPFASGGGCCG